MKKNIYSPDNLFLQLHYRYGKAELFAKIETSFVFFPNNTTTKYNRNKILQKNIDNNLKINNVISKISELSENQYNFQFTEMENFITDYKEKE